MADYDLEGVKWNNPDDTVTWSIAQGNYADRGYQFASFFPSDFLGEVEAAFTKWSSVADINFEQVEDSDGSDIRLGFNSIDGHYGTAGITSYSSFYSSSGVARLQQADIEIDSDEGWHLLDGHEIDSSNYNNLYPILLHEIGHALGLGHYSDAPAIMNPVQDVPDLTNSDIDGIQAIYGTRSDDNGSGNDGGRFTEVFRDDGTRVVDVLTSDLTLKSDLNDVFRNHGQTGNSFVFDPGYGHDVIGGFVVSGEGHSTIDLPASDFQNVADVLHHTRNNAGGLIIRDVVSGDTIHLAGIKKADLVQNRRQDFTFHA